MSQHWKNWAEKGLILARKHSPNDKRTIAALEEIIESGMEPYYTLKAAVNRLESMNG